MKTEFTFAAEMDRPKAKTISVRDEIADLIPRRDYVTHSFDRYPAKMIPQLARFGIEKCTTPGDRVLDPFCGCGTVLVESRISGRKATGIDINPYATLLAYVKSGLYSQGTLRRAVNSTVEVARQKGRAKEETPEWIGYWFESKTLDQLIALRKAIDEQRDALSRKYLYALQAILAVAVRLSSKADPRSPKPFISKRARERRVGKAFDALSIFGSQGRAFAEAAAEFRKLVKDGRRVPVSIKCADASKPGQGSEDRKKYDAVISSPPYLSAQDYYRSSKLEITILGLLSQEEMQSLGPAILGSGRGRTDTEAMSKVDSIPLPTEVKELSKKYSRDANVVATYISNLSTVTENCYEHYLKDGGKCCLVIGDSTVRGIRMPVHEWVVDIAEQAGLTFTKHYKDGVRDRRLPPKREGHSSVIRYEHILIFEK